MLQVPAAVNAVNTENNAQLQQDEDAKEDQSATSPSIDSKKVDGIDCTDINVAGVMKLHRGANSFGP